MDTLFARYFDGELSDREAKEFLDAVESNPKLEKELRAYEQVLAMGRKLTVTPAPAGFTQRVMTEVGTRGGTERWSWLRGLFGSRLTAAAVAASAVLFAFTGGWWFAKKSNGSADSQMATAGQAPETTVDVVPVHANQSAPAANGYRYVRLAYAPREAGVRSVHVAGNFNDWDPKSMPMKQQNDVWSTMLALPPGDYEYMFVVDDRQWVTDPLAVETRDDGFGGQNAVLEVDL